MSFRKTLGIVGLVVGVAALVLVPSGCGLFETTLTISNQSSFEFDFVEWTDDGGEVHYFGDTAVWDSVLGSWQDGLAIGDSDTEEVGTGSDYVYFYFTHLSTGYRTSQSVSVGLFEDVTFTLYDSTLIVARGGSSGESTTEVYDIVPSGRVKPGAE